MITKKNNDGKNIVDYWEFFGDCSVKDNKDIILVSNHYKSIYKVGSNDIDVNIKWHINFANGITYYYGIMTPTKTFLSDDVMFR